MKIKVFTSAISIALQAEFSQELEKWLSNENPQIHHIVQSESVLLFDRYVTVTVVYSDQKS